MLTWQASSQHFTDWAIFPAFFFLTCWAILPDPQRTLYRVVPREEGSEDSGHLADREPQLSEWGCCRISETMWLGSWTDKLISRVDLCGVSSKAGTWHSWAHQLNKSLPCHHGEVRGHLRGHCLVDETDHVRVSCFYKSNTFRALDRRHIVQISWYVK